MRLLASFSGMGGTLAGAYIGNMIFPGVGGLVGAVIGGAIGGIAGKTLFPEKYDLNSPPPPKPRENRVQLSTYGAPVPVVYGSAKLAGNIIYMSDITETVDRSKHRQDGVRYYEYVKTYTCTFAVAFCEGPVIGIERIWVNNEVFADYRDPAGEFYPAGSVALASANLSTTVARAAVYFSIYTGTQTQTADAELSAILGATETPAYRGICYIVFRNFPVGEFIGIPKIEIEIGSTTGVWIERQPVDDSDYQWGPVGISLDGSVMIAPKSNDYIYVSTDYGETWSAKGIPRYWVNSDVSYNGRYMIIGTNTRLYVSADYGNTWSEVQPSGDIDRLWYGVSVSNSGAVMAAAYYSSGKVYLSTNYCSTWSEIFPDGATTNPYFSCHVSADGNTIVVIDAVNDAFFSFDRGTSWVNRGHGVGVNGATAFSSDCKVGAVTSAPGHVYITTDYGVTWSEKRPSGASTQLWVGAAVNGPGNMIVVSNPLQNLFMSEDFGATWTEIEPEAGSTLGSIALDFGGGNLITCSQRSYSGRVYSYRS